MKPIQPFCHVHLAALGVDGLSVGRIVLAFLARQAIGRHEFRRDQTGRMTKPDELTRPVVSTGTCLHANEARRQLGDQLKQDSAFDARAYQYLFAGLIDAVYGEDVLGEIDSNSYDCDDFPFQVSGGTVGYLHRGTLLP